MENNTERAEICGTWAFVRTAHEQGHFHFPASSLAFAQNAGNTDLFWLDHRKDVRLTGIYLENLCAANSKIK